MSDWGGIRLYYGDPPKTPFTDVKREIWVLESVYDTFKQFTPEEGETAFLYLAEQLGFQVIKTNKPLEIKEATQ